MWSFSHQIRLVSRSLRQRGFNIIFTEAHSASGRIKYILNKKSVSFIMMHGYPAMFPLLFEKEAISTPIFFWAQVSGSTMASRFKEIKIKDLYLVPITPFSKHFLEASGCRGVTEVVPHMVDTAAFHPVAPDLRAKLKASFGLRDKFVYGKVAVNCSRKRLKDLIAIYAEVKSKAESGLVLKTRKLSLEGEDLGKFVKDMGLERDVVFIEDHLTAGRLNQIYNIFDLYCHVSEWEGFGLTVAEAMAAKVPVLAHATQGPGEYLPYKEFLVPSAGIEKVGETEVGLVDREEFKKKMILAYEKRGLLSGFAEQGYRYAHKNFSPEVVANKFLQIFKSVL
jgi:glycosyltransferase involved in cell wall biosynthesis